MIVRTMHQTNDDVMDLFTQKFRTLGQSYERKQNKESTLIQAPLAHTRSECSELFEAFASERAAHSVWSTANAWPSTAPSRSGLRRRSG